MNRTKVKHKYLESNLISALDKSIQAAENLKLSEGDLVAKLHQRFQMINNVISIKKPTRKIFNPIAGP